MRHHGSPYISEQLMTNEITSQHSRSRPAMNKDGPQRSRLRAKTGCLTCKSRRKKCDEQRPVCQRCTTSERCCKWPSADELIDRRYLSKRARQASPATSNPETSDILEVFNSSSPSPSTQDIELYSSRGLQISMLSEATSIQTINRGIEPFLANHFADTYYQTILLPDCHADFYYGWINDIQRLMTQHKSVYYSVLACSASQIHSLSNIPQMGEMALDFYSRSIKEVSRLLDTSSVATHDGLLNSIILLYLHGCLGLATLDDVPRHLDAAIQLLRLRFLDKPSGAVVNRPFDRIALESVLYQVFITTMGSWYRPPSDFRFDAEFWLQAEGLLSRSILFPDRSISFNSPVLGTPLPLLKLVLLVKQFAQSPFGQDEETLDQLKEESRRWEPLIFGNDTPVAKWFDEKMPHHQCYKDVTLLYILIASLLLDQISEANEKESTCLQLQPSSSWHVYEIRQILERHVTDEDWSRCFIGCWPVYTVGFFMSTSKDQDLVRSDLHRRWISTGSSQISRFAKELETAWTSHEMPVLSYISDLT